MKSLVLSLTTILILREAVGPPVTTKKGEEGHEENEIPDGPDWDLGVEYNRYLKEVVQALESDPQFKEKLEKAEATDIRTGKIARELEFVNHHVRSKLDELKRQELERLRHIAVMQYNQEQLQRHDLGEAEATGGGHRLGERPKLHIAPHLDHKNPHTFEVEDLRKLIVQTTKELEEADRKRKEEFKQYELQKEFEKQELLRRAEGEEQRKQLEKEFKEREEKHKKHPELHHPGSKQQLEEVWQEQDHMSPEDFNPKTFFHLHDLDGNGVWDADEVKTLFQKELDKMYDPSAPEDDARERQEEMERMREHVFNESDTNHDRLISYDEFLAQTKKSEFEQDPGWEGLDRTPAYTHEEYEAFERQRQEEVRRLVEQGLIPPQPVFHPPPMYHHPAAIPNQGYGQMHPAQQQYQHGGHIPQQQHPIASNQVYHAPPVQMNQPPSQYHPGQVQYHPNQQQPAQGYQGQGAYHGQSPPSNQGYQQHQTGYQQPQHQTGYQQPQHQTVYQQPQQPLQGYGQHPPASAESQNQFHHDGQPSQNVGSKQAAGHQQVAGSQQQGGVDQQVAGNQQPASVHQQVAGNQQPASVHQQVAGNQQPASVHQQVAGNQQQGGADQASPSHTNNPSSSSVKNQNLGNVPHPASSNTNQVVPNNQNAQSNNIPVHAAGEPLTGHKPSGSFP